MNVSASFEIVRILNASDSRNGDWRVIRALVRCRYDGHDIISPCSVLARKELADQLPVGATNLAVSGTISPNREGPRLTLVVESVAIRKRA